MSTKPISETLYDCVITYHLSNGEKITEEYRKDIPKEVWKCVRAKIESLDETLELDTHGLQIVILRRHVIYVTMRVLDKDF